MVCSRTLRPCILLHVFFLIGNKAILIVQSKILQLNLAPIDLQKFSVWEEKRNTEQDSELCVCVEDLSAE